MRHHQSDSLANDIESVALGTLLAGMRKLYWETEQYMRRRIEELEARYQALTGNAIVALEEHRPEPAAKRGRPRKQAASRNVGHLYDQHQPKKKTGWPDTAEERAVEMRRRQKVAAANRAAKLHPRDRNHPRHAEFVESVRKAQRKRWAGMSKAAQKRQIQRATEASVAARGKAQHVNGAAA
jgi:hypothetical protein